MVIGFDAKRLFCNTSGLGSYSRALVKNLVSHHPEVTIHLYTPKVVNNEDTHFFINHPNIHIHTFPFLSAFWRTLFIPLLSRRHDLDVFHGLSAELPFLPFGNGVKAILTVHDVLFKSRPSDYNLLDRWIYDLKLNYSRKRADEIICVSNHTRNQYLKHYKSNTSPITILSPFVNPLFMNTENHLKVSEFKSLYNLRNGFWLYVGSLSDRKNVNVLIEALTKVPDAKKKKLVLISNSDSSNIRQQAIDYGVEDWVRVESSVSDRELSLYYKNCTAVVYPSLAEGFGLPILEGLWRGATIICSDIAVHREVGGEQCIYFDPRSVDKLADILTSLSYYERKAKKETLSHLNTYNPAVICKKLMDIYSRK